MSNKVLVAVSKHNADIKVVKVTFTTNPPFELGTYRYFEDVNEAIRWRKERHAHLLKSFGNKISNEKKQYQAFCANTMHLLSVEDSHDHEISEFINNSELVEEFQ